MTVLPSYTAPDQSTCPTGIEEWPQLPGPEAQHLHGPSLRPTAMPRESPVVKSIRAPPTAIQPQEQGSQEIVTDSADRAMISNEKIRTDPYETLEPITSDTASNAPDAAQLASETYTLTRRQRTAVSQRLSKSSTACFSFDTPILRECLGFAYWQVIHKLEKGYNVVQTLPSGNINDLTGAIITSIKTNCSFEQPSTEGIEMVCMGSCCLTPHHHIRTVNGWKTARQAADMGQGEILTNYKHPRVYNLCLEGGGNILINTSRTPGLTTITTAATMGYRFETATDSQQKGSLTYPVEVRNRLERRQDLQFGRQAFGPGDVQTLSNGELVFKNITGIIPEKKRPGTGPTLSQLPTSLPNNSPTAKSLVQLEPTTATSFYKAEISGEPDTEESEPANAGIASSRRLSAEKNCSDQSHLAPGKTQPKSNAVCATRGLESSRPPPTHPDIKTEEFHLNQATAQATWLTPSFTPGTLLLILNAGQATWIPIWEVTCGTTAIQSLPSGSTGDVSGAQLATIEKVLTFRRGEGVIDIA